MMAVCVTGGTGFLGSHVCRALLDSDPSLAVRATVRDKSRHELVNPLLQACADARDRLQLFEADLLSPAEGGFAEALQGCTCLVHTATPVDIPDSNTMSDAELEAAFCDPAVSGTESLLAVALAAGVKQVVLTASTACMLGREEFDEPRSPSVMSSDVTSSIEWMRARKQWYRLAKTQQESAAREFCQRNKIGLITLHPSFIMGPYYGDKTTRLSIAHHLVHQWLTEPGTVVPNGHTGVVDVREVAAAHVAAMRMLAADAETAKGQQQQEEALSKRYLLNQSPLWHQDDLAEALRDAYPAAPRLRREPIEQRGYRAVAPTADCSPLQQELGVTLSDPISVVRATVQSLREKARL